MAMNLTKLFEMQKNLMNRINYIGVDRFEKTILALLVEVGECANEWRGFKYWSQDQRARREVKCLVCKGKGYFDLPYSEEIEVCLGCKTTGIQSKPLLEEYVDGFHFVLQIGHELEIIYDEISWKDISTWVTIEKQFISIYRTTAMLPTILHDEYVTMRYYEELIQSYIGLGQMFGFTWEEIEVAYYKKNEVNHERQNAGY